MTSKFRHEESIDLISKSLAPSLKDFQVNSIIGCFIALRNSEEQRHKEYFRASLEVIIDRTSSPIEILFGAHLLLISDGHGNSVEFNCDWNTRSSCKAWTVLMGSQIGLGPYRADFVLEHRYKERRVLIAVECDGHEFHEKTKEQAARDKARDRWMTTNGIRILRFTGTEIFNTPEHCASQVVTLLEKLVEESISICGSASI